MATSECEKNNPLRKYLFYPAFLFLGICIGLLAAWGFHRGSSAQGSDSAGTNFPTYGTDADVTETATGTDAVESNVPAAESINLIVNYPFPYNHEDWQLILHEGGTEHETSHARSGREFRLYDGEGQLVQTFPCILDAEELTFQFDRLFYYYEYDEDLVVFPADASETGAKGLCYPWEDETERFSEYPIEIPWYTKTGSDNVFLTTETNGDTVINTICRINEESRQVVELRKWALREESDGRGTLRILDCLTGQDLYWGEVELNSLGNPVNDKYFQYLFWNELETFWGWTNDIEIDTTKVTQNRSERITYQSREELLADCGFQGQKPFYECYDHLQRLELELFFDEQTGRGCGILYAYNHNYALEQVTRCCGFAFDQVTTEKWEPEDTFSSLSIHGENAMADNVSGYKEIYEYTDDGKLSSFASTGIIVDYGEDKEKTESTLLFMDYVYRSDGTLYHKQYSHHHILFGSYLSSQSCYYDEQGRITCKYCYTTSGSICCYYIYKDNREKPAYCLMLDSYGGPRPEMVRLF